MSLPAGAKHDLLVLQVAKTLLKIALDADTREKLDGAILRDRGNQLHKENARIDRRLQKLVLLVDQVFDRVGSRELYAWLASRTKSRLLFALEKVAHYQLQPETAGLYLLFVNFCERTKPLHESMAFFSDRYLYFDEIDLLKDVGISDESEYTAHSLATELLLHLKG